MNNFIFCKYGLEGGESLELHIYFICIVSYDFSICLYIFLLLVSVVYLVLQQRYKRRYARYLVYSREANATYDNPHGSQDINSSQR